MQHFYRTIPGWFSFQGVYTDAVKAAKSGAVFVEVGAWKGKSAAFMGVEIANSGKAVEFFAVDTWLGSDEPAHHADPDVKAGKLYERFLANIRPAAAYIHPIRATSVEASKLFEDGSVDFIMLDGDHTYEGVRDDIAAWLPKMKPGATFSGDDFNWRGVRQAIEEAFAGRIEVLGEGKGRHWRVRL